MGKNVGILTDRYFNETFKANPLAYYRMREGAGTTFTDSTAVPFNGTYSGTGVTWTATALVNGKVSPIFNSDQPRYTSSDGTLSIAQYGRPTFDGASGRASSTLTGINTAAASQVTVEFWFKWQSSLTNTVGTFQSIASFGGASGILLGFLRNATSDFRFGLSVRNTGDLWGLSNAQTLVTFQKDVWHHVVFVLTNNNVQASLLYVDGVPLTMTQQIGTTTTTDSVTSALTVAYDGTASWFQGQIGEFAVYNGAPYGTNTSVLDKYHVGAYGGYHDEMMQPPGLESTIEFNTAWIYGEPVAFNNFTGPTRQTDSFYVTDIGGLDDADIRFSEDTLPYIDGAYPLKTRYGGRTVTLEGFIDASNIVSLRRLQARLKMQLGGTAPLAPNNMLSGLGETSLVFRNPFDNAWDQTLNVKKSAPLQMKESQTDQRMRRPFMATLRASYPFFVSAGSRTEVMQLGASLYIPNKGNAAALPTLQFWGPYNSLTFVLGNTMFLSGTVAASSFISVDCRNRTTTWQFWNPAGDFPYIGGYAVVDSVSGGIATFVSAAGATPGVTRVEITWNHTSL